MSNTSAAKNYIYNTIYKILSLLTPLITAPYLARVIGVEGVGTFSYTYAISYNFCLLAKLGLMNYGSRSIAKARDNGNNLNRVFSEIYCLQVLSTMIATTAYIIYIIFFATKYNDILWINILYVLGIAIDIDWLYYGMENFKSIATRNMLVKLMTVVLILIFVKEKDDLLIYAAIMTISEFIKFASIWIGVPKHVRLSKVKFKDILIHFKPTLILFVPVIATSVYRLMDKIMLGSMSGMFSTGVYENSEKLIFLLMGFITSLEVVMMPRMSNLIENGRQKEAYDSISKSMSFVIALSSAMAFGIIGIRKQFIPWFYGEEFYDCVYLIPGLAITLCFIAWANVIRTQYIMPTEKDNIYVISTLVGAGINLVVNLALIPHYKAMGAVVGTVIAELSVALFLSFVVRKKLPLLSYMKKCLFYIIDGIIMAIIVDKIGQEINLGLGTIILQILVGAFIYISMAFIYIKFTQKDLYEHIKHRVKKRF